MNEEQKHTPEPWRLSGPDDFGDYTIQGPEDELAIAAVVNGEMRRMGGRSDEHRANARLMAAAPDLLEALEECVNALINEGRRGGVVMERARQAIAKAEGQANDKQ